MDYLRIGRLVESDFDGIIEDAGGRRFSADHSKEKKPNADYRLGSLVIELKIVEEEGLEKQTRQQKLANLFRESFPDKPTLILLPELLEAQDQRKYYRIMETPIKNHVRKAAKQLSISAVADEVKGLILVNNGYGALSQDEFKDIAKKCATNDTSNIDFLITCGLYYFSDRFDSYFMTDFDSISINNGKELKEKDAILDSFNKFINHFMTSYLQGTDPRKKDRLPLLDLDYEIDGFKFVKPAPKMGPSKFFINGRPRENSTGLTTCPPVARTFPSVSFQDWSVFKTMLPHSFWKGSYGDWLRFREEESEKKHTPLMPFVQIPVSPSGYRRWVEGQNKESSFDALCGYASQIFQDEIKKQIIRSENREDFKLLLAKYILLVVEEIGQDKANDVSSIYIVEDRMGREEFIPLFENKRIFFEHALGLAGAYAVKHGADVILHEVDKTFCWE